MVKTLVDILEENNIRLYDAGERKVAHCPFHEGDRVPSFNVYPNDTYYCFGCHIWGNALKFLTDHRHMTPKEAADYLEINDYSFPKAEKRVIKIKNMLKTSKFLYDVAESYHQYLLDNPGPLKYLESRGITLDTAKRFKLGYSDGNVLKLQYAEEYDMANEVGLLSKSGTESMSHRITIPNIIDNKYVDFMTGRTVINDKIKYYGLRMSKPMCGFYEFRKSPILFVVEGNFDYLILRQWGYPAIVLSGSSISRPNKALLKDKQIIYIPDNDEAGLAAANKIKASLPNTIIIDYKSLGVKDIGELATLPSAQTRFENIIREQLWELFSVTPNLIKYMPFSTGLTL